MLDGQSFLSSPAFNYTIIGLIVVAMWLYIKFNAKILSFIGRTGQRITKFFNKYLGVHLRNTQTKFRRSAFLNKSSWKHKLYKFYDEMIVNLDLHRDGVTVTGLIIFLVVTSSIGAFVMTVLMNLGGLFFGAAAAIFFLITSVFRLTSMTRMERKEEIIMDSIDLLVSDIRGGVFNGIIRYKDNFDPSIRYAFYEYIDNRQNKGYSGAQAMLLLNDQLGYTFTDFAQKAIMYEERADDSMDDIFSSIIETNRHRRNLRFLNNVAFNKLRTQFIIASTIILGYALFTIWFEPWIRNVLINTMFGKIMIIADVCLFAFVLSYLTSIKSKAI